ncbi:MAG: hydroxymethylglutaryl-CoA lyase, partial [Myxococcota bacterium]
MIRVIEVGPRDGLQNEPSTIPTEAKVEFVNRLGRTGVDEIEVSAFVSPKRVPQLSDAGQVFAAIDRVPGVIYSA